MVDSSFVRAFVIPNLFLKIYIFSKKKLTKKLSEIIEDF